MGNFALVGALGVRANDRCGIESVVHLADNDFAPLRHTSAKAYFTKGIAVEKRHIADFHDGFGDAESLVALFGGVVNKRVA